MAVGFGGIVAEAFQDIDSDLLLFAEAFMGLKACKQLILQLYAFIDVYKRQMWLYTSLISSAGKSP